METENLSNYFKGVAVKRLSAVEADSDRSNQHEFNGVSGLKNIFGKDKRIFETKLIYLGEKDEDAVTTDGLLTWYDARENHPERTEHRLYFPTTAVSENSKKGDLLLIGQKPDGSVLVVVTKENSNIESQILWLFGLQQVGESFSTFEIEKEKDIDLGFGPRFILEELGIPIKETNEKFLELMLKEFNGSFPPTKLFSKFARETIPEVTSKENSDSALMAWVNQEEILFRTLEGHIVKERLKNGFGDDGWNVDEFISYSLSVHNRRKSRMGHALENHLEYIFKEHSLKYSRGKITEQKRKPDFIFPGIEQYRNPDFPEHELIMLGVKSTCKDRWRQVLSEAKRIPAKHLLTLEPGISEHQTEEMKESSLQLVIPKELQSSFKSSQQNYLWDVSELLDLLVEHQ